MVKNWLLAEVYTVLDEEIKTVMVELNIQQFIFVYMPALALSNLKVTTQAAQK